MNPLGLLEPQKLSKKAKFLTGPTSNFEDKSRLSLQTQTWLLRPPVPGNRLGLTQRPHIRGQRSGPAAPVPRSPFPEPRGHKPSAATLLPLVLTTVTSQGFEPGRDARGRRKHHLAAARAGERPRDACGPSARPPGTAAASPAGGRTTCYSATLSRHERLLEASRPRTHLPTVFEWDCPAGLFVRCPGMQAGGVAHCFHCVSRPPACPVVAGGVSQKGNRGVKE